MPSAVGYQPIDRAGANLFFQLINARYEHGVLILTSNRGFGEWTEIFGDAVVASVLLDRLLHHAIVIHWSSVRRRRPVQIRTRPLAPDQLVADLPL